MDTFEYVFTSNTGDRYIVKILQDGARFLSSHVVDMLKLQNVEVWGIYLNRVGSFQHVASMRDLSIISRQIYGFFMSHENALLYYVCDDISEVPMNARKKAEGYTVQYYRNKLFSNLFQKFQGALDIRVVDTPICIDACGNEMFIHLIARKEQENFAEQIKQDVIEGFSK